jgi:hypothetical protein
MIRSSRILLLALCGAGALAFAVDAQQPKPKKVVVSDPKELKDDKDYAIQGEYEGSIVLNRGEAKVGVQVIAKGEGKFTVKMLMGGLPGAGWDGKEATMAEAKLDDDGSAKITGKLQGTIGGGKIALKDGMKIDTSLTKVERKSKTMGEKAPSGADVLYAEPGDESKWNGGKVIELSDGKFLNRGIKTKKLYGSFKAHIEFRLPWMPGSTGQGRGNSGFYLQDRYELQILDSFGLKGENNECGGIYTLHKPSVNMCLPPMVWQTYDIDFTAAEFDGDKKTKPARVTVLHNGVKIQDDVELKNSTGGGQPESSKPGAIQLQDHGDPLVFRNVWIVEKK